MEAAKKKRAMLAVVCVALVALIAAAGTVAYLQDSTDDVVNTFDTNQVAVDLKETTGNEYNIVPGTTQDKDPKVTVTADIPAYVYVEVTDTTGGAVDWALADGWMSLEGYDNVYYREYDPGQGATSEFPVIANNTVSYSASLTNDDLAKLSDPKLTFKAYAIQKAKDDAASFSSEEGYAQARYGMSGVSKVGNAEELKTAIANGEAAVLTSDVSANLGDVLGAQAGGNGTFLVDKTASIDLDGHVLSDAAAKPLTVTQGASLSVANGDLRVTGFNYSTTAAFGAEKDSMITLEQVHLTTDGSALLPKGDAAEVNVIDSTIDAATYGVATNAATAENYNVIINIRNSTIAVSNSAGDNAAVFTNVPSALTIENSTIVGERQAVAVRVGTATISNSTITLNGKYSTPQQYYDAQWGGGNEVPAAALLVGNCNESNSGYNTAKAECSISDSKLSATSGFALIYMDGNSVFGSSLTLNGCGVSDDAILTHSTDSRYCTVVNNS